MSTNEAESGNQAEVEPMTEEGKAKVEEIKTNEDIQRNKSIRVRVMEARNESKGKLDFVTAVLSIFVGSVIGLIGLALANIISIAQIVIGALYINDCTLRPGIPIILIINGSIGVLQSICESTNKRIETNSNKRNSDSITNPNTEQLQKNFRILVNILRLLAIGSFIAWCVLVYGSYEPDFEDTNSGSYCHRTLYLFAFWLLNVYFIILALFICCCCCCLATSINTRD